LGGEQGAALAMIGPGVWVVGWPDFRMEALVMFGGRGALVSSNHFEIPRVPLN